MNEKEFRTNISNDEYLEILSALCSTNHAYGRYTYTNEVYKICDDYNKYNKMSEDLMHKSMAMLLAVFNNVNISNKQTKIDYCFDVTNLLFSNERKIKSKIKNR